MCEPLQLSIQEGHHSVVTDGRLTAGSLSHASAHHEGIGDSLQLTPGGTFYSVSGNASLESCSSTADAPAPLFTPDVSKAGDYARFFMRVPVHFDGELKKNTLPETVGERNKRIQDETDPERLYQLIFNQFCAVTSHFKAHDLSDRLIEFFSGLNDEKKLFSGVDMNRWLSLSAKGDEACITAARAPADEISSRDQGVLVSRAGINLRDIIRLSEPGLARFDGKTDLDTFQNIVMLPGCGALGFTYDDMTDALIKLESIPKDISAGDSLNLRYALIIKVIAEIRKQKNQAFLLSDLQNLLCVCSDRCQKYGVISEDCFTHMITVIKTYTDKAGGETLNLPIIIPDEDISAWDLLTIDKVNKPRLTTPLSMEQLPVILRFVLDSVSPKAFEFGCALGLKPQELSILEQNHSADGKRFAQEVLIKWFLSAGRNDVTPERLIKALESKIVSQGRLAENFRKAIISEELLVLPSYLKSTREELDKLDALISRQEMFSMTRKWFDLGLMLAIHPDKLYQIEQEKRSYEEKLYNVLTTYRQRRAGAATWAELKRAIIDVNSLRTVQDIERKYGQDLCGLKLPADLKAPS